MEDGIPILPRRQEGSGFWLRGEDKKVGGSEMKLRVCVGEQGNGLRFTLTIVYGGDKKTTTEEFEVTGADTTKIEEWLEAAASAHTTKDGTTMIASRDLVAAFHSAIGQMSGKLTAIELTRTKPHLGYNTFA